MGVSLRQAQDGHEALDYAIDFSTDGPAPFEGLRSDQGCLGVGRQGRAGEVGFDQVCRYSGRCLGVALGEKVREGIECSGGATAHLRSRRECWVGVGMDKSSGLCAMRNLDSQSGILARSEGYGAMWLAAFAAGHRMRYNKVIGCAPLLKTTQGGCYDVTLIIEGTYK